MTKDQETKLLADIAHSERELRREAKILAIANRDAETQWRKVQRLKIRITRAQDELNMPHTSPPGHGATLRKKRILGTRKSFTARHGAPNEN